MSKGAGNIPTGNGAVDKCNHFIVTPSDLAEIYKEVLNTPHPRESLRGDLTAMLSYTKSFYDYKLSDISLLEEFKSLIKSFEVNETRQDANMNMLQNDAQKFKFVPDGDLYDKGFNSEVKKEIYRFPSILLLDVCIVSGCFENSSWESLETLYKGGMIFSDVQKALQFLLASATYLHHNSHDDRMSVAPEMLNKTEKA